MALDERLLDASSATSTDPIHMKDQTPHRCENIARSGDSLQDRIFHGIKSQFLPKKKAPPTIGTMAVRLSNPLLNLDQTQRMREFAQKATAMISDTASYSDKVLAWKGILQEGMSLWETKQKDVDGWRVLGFLEKLCSLAPANMEVVQVLIGKFPDELKLKLKAVEEYPEYFADRLYRAYTNKKKEIPSDLTECWARATLIGSYQRRIKAEAPEKLGTTRIDKIIKEYLMAAKLPQVKEDMEKMIGLSVNFPVDYGQGLDRYTRVSQSAAIFFPFYACGHFKDQSIYLRTFETYIHCFQILVL
ncbi:uncharacterized protein MELLADRAFT_106879 [Melampsora larici-populina 98AG31]|uniref:Uncharacterized protein n=1 Tax=Melampsora larici-populina (strain 98AG31 / pathotype 3-4-7) TaxID=747676 RepID=F4RMY3_MELLP|nr:uncharacterized protein MELLADRAFT_106879 [Melampsora larici-populina 98AG31]EGG06197.1 hypothetical protein MELLADRAFT_106879 [Melampsora larici-populina 98AG31]